MTSLPLLPITSEIEVEKWQRPPRPRRSRLLSTFLFSHLSLPHSISKQTFIIPVICLLFTLGYILRDQIVQPPSLDQPPPTVPDEIPPLSIPDIQMNISSHPSILIFQHFAFHDKRVYHLQNESIAQHERYAKYWGYRYIRSFDQYVSMEGKTTRQRQMNKLYALLEVVLGEIALGDKGAEWIIITDADTLIVNPLVPIHSLLPPLDLHPNAPPLIVGTEDGNGFNSGVMILRTGLDLVAFISRAIVLSDNVTWDFEHPDSDTSSQREGEGEAEVEPPSDQRAICLVLQSDPVTAARYYPYPQEWLNSYVLPSAEQAMVLQIHLVANRKYMEDLSPCLDTGHEAWRVLDGMSTKAIEESTEELRRRAREHWESVKLDAPKCTWQ